VRESRDRVRAAIANSGFQPPARRVTVSLAPADLPKDGGRFDLPIALGVLVASGQVRTDRVDTLEFLGELSLGGELRGVIGTLPALIRAREAKRTLILPAENGPEAGLVRDADCRLAGHLTEVTAALQGRTELNRPTPVDTMTHVPGPDLVDVRGQARARRALEVAAAGGHNLLLIGPPGTGKTLLASRLPGILPPLDEHEALEAAAIASVCGEPLDPGRWLVRPFRAPHHTASGVALVGGGTRPRPGEVSRAHHGVLFLDELPEFDRKVLDVLREPLESGSITISRAAHQAEFPADVQLVAAMNPCPCGYAGDPSGRCRCTPDQVIRYQSRVSGPLLDRIDLHVEVPRQRLSEHPTGEASAAVAERVAAARARQAERGAINARLSARALREHAAIDDQGEALLERAAERLGLSARAHQRIIRVARTLADLEGLEAIGTAQLAEAIGYRQLDRAPP
jgi:magnesium chelatase family protein